VLALVLAFFLLAGLTRAAKLGCCQQADMGCWQLANAPYASYLPCRVNVRACGQISPTTPFACSERKSAASGGLPPGLLSLLNLPVFASSCRPPFSLAPACALPKVVYRVFEQRK
jgi:hypothetical protein